MFSHSEILLVIPAWNDSVRLGRFAPGLAKALAESGLNVQWVIADDGSSEAEVQQLNDLVMRLKPMYDNVSVMRCSRRFRKGGAIYEAWDQNTTADWFAFVDADGAIDAATVVEVLQRVKTAAMQTGFIGVRQDSRDTPVQRPAGRVLSFKVFSTLVRALVDIQYSDTQCGLKIIPAASYHRVAPRLVERGFVFDVELLLAIEQSGCMVHEVAIPWSEMPAGKVSPLRDAWAMFGGLLRIRQRLKKKHYIIT